MGSRTRYFNGDIIVSPYASEIDVMEFFQLMSTGDLCVIWGIFIMLCGMEEGGGSKVILR